jgi:hypothetical protein
MARIESYAPVWFSLIPPEDQNLLKSMLSKWHHVGISAARVLNDLENKKPIEVGK